MNDYSNLILQYQSPLSTKNITYNTYPFAHGFRGKVSLETGSHCSAFSMRTYDFTPDDTDTSLLITVDALLQPAKKDPSPVR